MSDRIIQIIVDVADKTGGKLNGLKEQLLAMDKAVQKMHDKMKNFADRKYAATLRLIDRVSEPGGKINSLLKRLAGKVHGITIRLNDAALGKIRELEAKLMRLAGKAWTIAVNVKDNLKGKFGGLMDGLAMGAGVFAPIAGAAGIGYGVANGLQAYMDFQQQMSRVQAVANLSKTDPLMIQLTEKAKELGASTEWTRSEAAQAMYYQAMAGWSPDKILAATPSIMHLASAGGTDLATTSDILTDTMTGFRINAGDKFKDAFGREVEVSQHYADMMATLVTSSNTNISQLGEALKYSANVVGAMYNDKPLETRMHAAEDAMVMTGLMANAGIKGSMAGTSTRAVFSRFGAENRNAYNALRALGVEFTDKDTGEVRRIRDVMKDLHNRFTEGVDPNQLLEFAEAISGEKIHADTRRKLNSFIESTQKNGGKMTGADMLKMGSMLAGQEAMSGFLAAILGDWDELATKIDNAHGAAERMAEVQLDNLAGDVKILGSAWDAFQQSFFEGQAGEGLRAFTQTLTDMVSNATKLFSDGIQIGDIFSVIGDAIGRLRDKFLQFDGIGSLLAGGALMAGLLKIGSTIQKVIGYFKQLRAAEIGTRLGGGGGNPPPGKPPPGLAGNMNVGTMNVKAGVVNIAGKVNGGAGGGAGGAGGAGGGGAGGRRVGDRTIIDRYNRERERIRGAGGAGGAGGGGGGSPSPTSRFAGMKSAAKGGAAFAAIFGALDFFSTRSMSADRLAEANEELALAQREYKEQLAQGATQDVLADYTKRIADAQQAQLSVMKENRAAEAESLGGATGAVIGTALGAAIGSLVGPVGTMVGGIVGGMAGDYLGAKLARVGVEREENLTSTAKADVSTDTIAKYSPVAKELKAIEERENPKGAFDEITMTTKKKLMPWLTDRDANYFGYNGEDLLKYADDWWGGKKKQPSWSEFRMTDAGLKPPNLSKTTETLEQWQARIEAETAEFAAAHKPKPKDFSGTSFFDTPISQPFTTYDEGQAALRRYEASGKQATTATSSLTDKLKEFAPSVEGVLGTIAAAFPALMGMFPDTLDKLLFNRSEAAELTDEQRLTEGQVPTEMPTPPEVKPEESMNLDEWFNFDGLSEKLSEFGEMISEGFSSAFEGAGETLSEFGEIISEGFSTAFEGAGETLSEFGEVISEGFSTAFEGVEEIFGELGEIISEGLSSTLEGAGEIFSEFGEMISEGLSGASEMASEIISTLGETISEGITTALTTAGEMFASFGELVSSGLAAAQGAAESALSAIGSAFESTKAMIMGAWSELPGFFSGIFSTLGGVAAAAGSAIYSGLTSVIGAVIGAWQGAAATVSSIIASISAAASSVASMIPSFGGGGGGGGAFAEGGFVTSPTQALVGEAGAEVIIPLSASKRARAMELFEKTAGILGGDALNVGGDQFQSELDNELADEAPYSSSNSESLDADKPVANSEGESKSSGATVNLGGMQVTFNIEGASNPQEIMHTIRENLADVADRVGAWLAKSIDNINQNQPLEA